MTDHDCRDSEDTARSHTRRQYLGGSAAVLTAATAGCSGLLGGGGGGDPAASVETYLNAIDEGDAETANGLLHPDGSATEISDEQAEQLSAATITVESTEVLEQGDGRADVEVSFTMGFDGQENSQTSLVELQTHDGEWKLYSGSIAE